RFFQNGQLYYNHTMTRFWYTGREMLGNEYGGIGAGLYDYRNRIYSTVHGRFMQPDPIGFDAKDVNWNRYVFNSPVNYTDPDGMIVNILLGAVAGVIATEIWNNIKYDCQLIKEELSDDKCRRYCDYICTRDGYHYTSAYRSVDAKKRCPKIYFP
ncbi:MAG: hypothetical protein NZM04_10415, partial [Methylacidiphilales bacterium]|nr:hypothetical protein [Candidatus Methylacidiphilales bacterium]